MQKLGRLRETRKRAMLSQAELAERAGVSRDAIVRLETGKRRAQPATGRKLAAALGVEPRELVENETVG